MMLRWASSIFGLFALCGPTAVLWRVISIVVDTIKAVMRRWFPSHIGEKVFVFVPSFTDRNASSSIQFITGSFLITTTIMHIFPRYIFCRSVIGLWSPRKFVSQTAARTGSSAKKIAFMYLLFLPTIASTYIITFMLRAINNRPSSKPLIYTINWG